MPVRNICKFEVDFFFRILVKLLCFHIYTLPEYRALGPMPSCMPIVFYRFSDSLDTDDFEGEGIETGDARGTDGSLGTSKPLTKVAGLSLLSFWMHPL